jgi:hypothetical protein
MGKSRTNSRGLTREQELLKENKALKREVSKYRKMLARNDLNRYENVKDAIEEFNKDSGLPTTQELLDALKREWKCRECEEGVLEVVLFNKLSDTFYFRACNCCSNRTKSKKYSPSVRGIIKKTEVK